MSSSSSSGESSDEKEKFTEADFLVQEIELHTDILLKSQKPGAKEKKEAAVKAIRKNYVEYYGQDISTPKLIKKIHNMKSRLKTKVELCESEGRPIKYLAWEKKMVELLEESTEKSALKFPDGSVKSTKRKTTDKKWKPPRPPQTKIPKTSRVHERSLLYSFETDETEDLTIPELERLILLQKLALIKEKRKYLREKHTSRKPPRPEFHEVQDSLVLTDNFVDTNSFKTE